VLVQNSAEDQFSDDLLKTAWRNSAVHKSIGLLTNVFKIAVILIV
jgi:hypothetical protein